jgi:hypothetical protein
MWGLFWNKWLECLKTEVINRFQINLILSPWFGSLKLNSFVAKFINFWSNLFLFISMIDMCLLVATWYMTIPHKSILKQYVVSYC